MVNPVGKAFVQELISKVGMLTVQAEREITEHIERLQREKEALPKQLRSTSEEVIRSVGSQLDLSNETKSLMEDTTRAVSQMGSMKLTRGDMSRLRGKALSLASRANLVDHRMVKANREHQQAFEKYRGLLYYALEIHEKRGIPLEEITDEMILKEKERKAQQAFDEIWREESDNVTKNKRKKKKKKVQQKKKPLVSLPKDGGSSAGEKKQTLLDLRAKYCTVLRLRKSFKEHPRVTKRWSTKEIASLRQIKDFDEEGNVVYRYQKLSVENLLIMRAYHYLPGTEKLIFDPLDRKKYTFPTATGVAMMCEMAIQKRRIFGVLYFGMNEKERVIYHRFFEEKSFTGFQEVLQSESLFGRVSVLEDKGEWKIQGRFSFSLLDGDVVHIKYPEETHSISIYPLHLSK